MILRVQDLLSSPPPMASSPVNYSSPPFREDMVSSSSAAVRLSLLSCVAAGGSVGGVFIISAVVVMEPLRARGNAFLASAALAHLLVSAVVLPSMCVAILANVAQDSGLCRFQWALVVVCFFASVLSYAFLSCELRARVSSSPVTHRLCWTKSRVLLAVLFCWTSAIALAAAQRAFDVGPNFCSANGIFLLPVHVPVACVFIGLPILVSVICFACTACALRRNDPADSWARELLQSHVTVYVMTIAMWGPAVVAASVSLARPVASHLIDAAWWMALSHSCTYSYIYAATHRTFRVAFAKLFFYCCCKSHVTFSRPSTREQRGGQTPSGSSGLRVHIIPAMNIYSAKKEAYYGGGQSKHCSQSKSLHCSYDL
ncbi:uncharacterized protein LOC135378215 [Ornithodoros turicata]|uniref:uncharacterized protein LOC135378215 n=1 Tax=Ornithodoros turicata TaxID=34597 RepID=UPI00313A2484